MTKTQYNFALLGDSEIFEPYLSSELKKNSNLWKPTEFELPQNDPGLAAAFLTLTQPDAVFYAPRFSNRNSDLKNAAYLAALSQALETKDSLLVSWLKPVDDIPAFINCQYLFIRLPEVFYCSVTKNLITEWIDKILSRKRVTVSSNKPLRLIGRHLLVQMTAAAALKCLANPGFDRTYKLAANGETSLFELVGFGIVSHHTSQVLPCRRNITSQYIPDLGQRLVVIFLRLQALTGAEAIVDMILEANFVFT